MSRALSLIQVSGKVVSGRLCTPRLLYWRDSDKRVDTLPVLVSWRRYPYSIVSTYVSEITDRILLLVYTVYNIASNSCSSAVTFPYDQVDQDVGVKSVVLDSGSLLSTKRGLQCRSIIVSGLNPDPEYYERDKWYLHLLMVMGSSVG